MTIWAGQSTNTDAAVTLTIVSIRRPRRAGPLQPDSYRTPTLLTLFLRFRWARRRCLTNRVVIRAGYGICFHRLSNQLGLLTSQSAHDYLRTTLTGAGNIASTLQNPFPVLPQQSQYPILPVLFSPPYTNDKPAIGLNSVDPNLRTPYIQQWGTNVQWAATNDMMVEVGYVGTKGVSLPDRRAINQAVLANPTNPINGQTTNTSANTQLRVPFTGL